MEVCINVTKRSDFIIIELRDTGWGIDRKDLPCIGERFFSQSKCDES